MKNLILSPNKQINIKISNAPRCGVHFLNYLLLSLPKETYSSISPLQDLRHNFVIEGEFWNLVTVLRNPIDSIASHTTTAYENRYKIGLQEKQFEEIMDLSIDIFERWYKDAIKFKSDFFYLFDFESLIKNPTVELNKFLEKLNLPPVANKINSNEIFDLVVEDSELYIKTAKKSIHYHIIKDKLLKKDISFILNCHNILLNEMNNKKL